MSWFRLDDAVAFGAKTEKAGNEAFGAWCRAGAWSSAQGTEGKIPIEVAHKIGPARLWRRLAEAIPLGHSVGLIEVLDGGYLIHDFLVYNPTVSEVLAKREARSTAGRIGGLRSAASKANAKQTPSNCLGVGSSNVQANLNPLPSPPLASTKQDPEAAHEAPKAPKIPESIQRYAKAFAAGIVDAAGGSFVPPTDPRWRGHLSKTCQAHGGGRKGPDLDAWIRSSVAEYRRERPADGQYGGFTPENWRKWLDARPAAPVFPKAIKPNVLLDMFDDAAARKVVPR